MDISQNGHLEKMIVCTLHKILVQLTCADCTVAQKTVPMFGHFVMFGL